MENKSERLEEIYNNSNNSDNGVIVLSVNTLENEKESFYVLIGFIDIISNFRILYEKSEIKRPDIKYIIDETNKIPKNLEDLKTLVNRIDKKNITKEHKYLFMMLYYRVIFENSFKEKTFCHIPEYIKDEKEPWMIFLDSI